MRDAVGNVWAELRRAPLWMVLVAAYLFTTVTLTLLRVEALRGGEQLEGSAAQGVGSHVATWFVVAVAGAFAVLAQGRRGMVGAGVLGLLLALLAAIWEFDALSAPSSAAPRPSVAWLFLAGLILAPVLGGWSLLLLEELSRRRRGSSH